MPDRTEALLGSLPKTSRIVEIGPAFDPIAPKSQGWNSVSIDHLNQEGLREKYSATPGIRIDRIEPVDFVWSGGLLSDAVPTEQHGSFDVFLASHVIEHTPDLVGFLDAAQTLLKPDGVVVLAVPDKRFCFDYFQPLTTTGQVLDAHAKQRRRHSGERAFDHFAYAMTDAGEQAWARRPVSDIRLLNGLEFGWENYALFEEGADYQDLHAWHFVPSSFELLLLELARLGATDWQIDQLTRTLNWEFLVRLRRGGAAQVRALPTEVMGARRAALLKRSLLEIQEQIDWLLEGEPELQTEQALISQGSTAQKHKTLLAALEQNRAETTVLRDRLLASEAGHAEAVRQLTALQQSTSWRATALLRSLIEWVRRRGNAKPALEQWCDPTNRR